MSERIETNKPPARPVVMIVNNTSPTQLQDGTTYDSVIIIHHIYMKSIKNYSEKLSENSSLIGFSSLSEVINFSFTGYEKFFPIF